LIQEASLNSVYYYYYYHYYYYYYYYYLLLSIARIREETGDTHSRSLAELLNGTFLAVPRPSSSSSASSSSSSSTVAAAAGPLYVEDHVHIVYAVGRHIQDFRYRLEIIGSEVITLKLHLSLHADNY